MARVLCVHGQVPSSGPGGVSANGPSQAPQPGQPPKKYQRTDSAIQRAYDAAPGPPSKHDARVEGPPSAPPAPSMSSARPPSVPQPPPVPSLPNAGELAVPTRATMHANQHCMLELVTLRHRSDLQSTAHHQCTTQRAKAEVGMCAGDPGVSSAGQASDAAPAKPGGDLDELQKRFEALKKR